MLTLEDLADGPGTLPVSRSGDFWQHGFEIHHGLIPHDVIDAYVQRFSDDAETRVPKPGPWADAYRAEVKRGYGIGTPYLTNPELRDVCLHRNLVPIVEGLFGEAVGLHLNLTGWQSTQRAWHVDSYLSPAYVGMKYAATWIALDDIDPDAGPFEYVPDSHLWPAPTRAKVLFELGENLPDGNDGDWPWRSEQILGPLYDREIINRGGHIERFIAKKGDVLIWSANTVHRGSMPVNPELERRTLISHYSVVSSRYDMAGTEKRWENEHAAGTLFALGRVS